MSAIILYTERCKGCRLCVEACPRGAITPLEAVNKKGYEITRVDVARCVGCGCCYKVCPDYVYEIVRQGAEERG